ncbi:mucin-13 isoform X2 [Pelodiscus sinensis]|uniref:mucin-13 isoform X2 n=1 Tax=Pelodiscus sinensis TaxID=13735 RepID=UPI003F6CBFC3
MKGYVSLVLLLSIGFCAKTEAATSSTTEMPTYMTTVSTSTATSTLVTSSITTTASTTTPLTATIQETTTSSTLVITTTQEITTSSTPVSTTTQETTTPSTPVTTTTQETTTPSTTASAITTTAIATTTHVTSESIMTALTTTTTTALLDSTTQVSPFSTTTGTVSSTTPTPITQSPPPCANKPCVSSTAECINLYDGYICQCPYSYYYTQSGCQEGKVFPGLLTLNAMYTEDMIIVNSSDFKELYMNVTDFFNTTFQNETSYGETKIVNVIQFLANSRIQSRAVASGINVTVKNVFELTTTLNASEVTKLIQAAINGSSNFNLYSYYALTPCVIYDCDETTTTCNDTSGVPVCECKPGLSKKNAADKTCSNCESTCSKDNHMHCIANNSIPVCQCLPDFYKKDGKCVKCNVGFSGVDCNNNTLLILIIVAVLCGILILGLVAGLICTSMRSKKLKNPEKRHLIKEDYSGGKGKLGPMSVSNPAAKDRIFPTIPTSVSNPAAKDRIFPTVPTSVSKPATKDRIFPTVPTSASSPAAKDRIFPTVQTNNAGQVNRGFQISNPYEIAPPMRMLPERDYDDDDEEYEMSLRGDRRPHYRY